MLKQNHGSYILHICISVGKLMELHGEGGGKTIVTETGEKIERADNFEPPVLESV